MSAQSMIQALLAGRQMKQQQEERAKAAEDRKLHQELLKLELARAKLSDKFEARKEAQERARMLEGTPGQDIPPDLRQGPPETGGIPITDPGGAVAMNPTGIGQGFDMETGTPQPFPTGIDLQPINPEAQNRFKPVMIPGVYGQDTPVTPRTLMEVLAQQAATKRAERSGTEHILAPGASLYREGEGIVASNQNAPANEALERVVGSDGKPTYVRRSEAVGRQPYYPPRAAAASGQSVGGPMPTAMSDLTPVDQAIVKSVLEYKYPVPTGGFAMNNPRWQRIIGAAMTADPSFDATQYSARQRLRQDMTSGKSANNIKSFNTAIAHLETLKKAGEALQNWSFTPANTVRNAARTMVGRPMATNFMNAANAVAAEAATAFKGTAGTDQEIKAWRSGLSENMSPDQIDGAVRTITELLAGRIGETNGQYERGMGKPKDFHFLSDKSRRILSELSVDVDAIDPAGQANATTAGAADTAASDLSGRVRMRDPQSGREMWVRQDQVSAASARGAVVVAGGAAGPSQGAPKNQATRGAEPAQTGTVRMTDTRAAEIIQAQTGRPATPGEIQRFMKKYPFELNQ